jgi:hypothetical protein
MNRDAIQGKLTKLLALARAGEGGERENAKTLLGRLMHKYDFSLADLERGPSRVPRLFEFENDWEKRLLGQLLYRVMGDDRKAYFTHRAGERTPYLCADLDPSEHAEVELMYGIYRRQLEREFERLFTAYLGKHDLFVVSPHGVAHEMLLSQDDRAAIQAMTNALDAISILPVLDAPEQAL